MKINALSYEDDCCAKQIPYKTLYTPLLELLTPNSITRLYENSASFYVWWMENVKPFYGGKIVKQTDIQYYDIVSPYLEI